ncbi:hypothetical protein FACS1894130_13190 [Spirochaetia bacterium]|nr:hypothetical protein FACS1894130_13190 [Spirochaetia bacterium]
MKGILLKNNTKFGGKIDVWYNWGKTMRKEHIFVLLLLLSVTLNAFTEEHLTGKMLIMGWNFEEEDSPLQTNIAIDAIIKYVEASKYQMNSFEKNNPSCRMELYREKPIYEYESFQNSFFMYINIKDDYYHDRYIEIDFYIIHNEIPSKFKLVLNYNNYKWSKNNEEKNQYEIIMKGDSAYDFFISEIEKLRR